MMSATKAIQIAVVQVDMVLCGAGRIVTRAIIPALIITALYFVVVKKRRL